MIEVRLRRVEIAHVGNFNIPTNVSRVDHRLTHGWNVRFLSRGQRSSKFFSDNLLGGPRKSFRAACAYANEHRPMPKTQAVEGIGGGMRFVEAIPTRRKTPLCTWSFPASASGPLRDACLSGRATRPPASGATQSGEMGYGCGRRC